MKHESIKVGNTVYNIANGSCSLNDLSGNTSKVAIIIGSNEVMDIHKNLSENTTVIKYDANGVEEWKQDNLVFTGQPIFNPSFPIGIEQVQTGANDDGKPLYKYEEVMDAVLIVEYRTPNIQDELKEQKQTISSQNTKISQLSALTGVCVGDKVSGNPTLEELKEIKKKEINAECGQTVCNGLTVELSNGPEHFSLYQSK